MLALGLLFMIVAAAVTAGAIYDGGESAEFEVFGQTIGTTIGGIFVAGLATMLLFFVGVWMLMRSLARSRRKRIERKETKNRQKESVSKIEDERAQLRAENEALQERLASERSTTASTDATRVSKPSDGTTDTSTGTSGATDTTFERPTGRVEHQDTDLTAQQEAASSGRHRDA
jgi:uncharacterized protein YlxW (UPF0749 family)